MTVKKFKWVSFALVACLALALLFAALAAPTRVASAEGEKIVLEQVVQCDAVESAIPGVYAAVHEGDEITVTYKLVSNDGMKQGGFTPAFDESAFRLVSFAVDTNYYVLMNDYSHPGVDPVTGDPIELHLTAAEFIAEHNAAIDAGDEPYTSRLTFYVTYVGEKGQEAVLSDHFITVKYVAAKDLIAPLGAGESAVFGFGFNMANNGQYTNAAASGDLELAIFMKEGEDLLPLSDSHFTMVVKAAVNASVPQDQTIHFVRSGDDVVLNVADIAVDYVYPAFDPTDVNPYLADGGEVTFLFYEKDGDEFVLIKDQYNNPAYPDAVDMTGVYVRAVFAGTDHYLGYEMAEPVHISIAPMYVPVPDLRLYASDREEAGVYDSDEMTVALADVTYGSDLTLKELVGEEEVAFALPAADETVVGDFAFAYYVKDQGEYVLVDYDPLTTALLPVGEYMVVITPVDPVRMSFLDAPQDQIAVLFNVVPATLTLRAFVGGQALVNLTYGAPVPDASVTYAVEGVAAADDFAAVVAALDLSVGSENPYAQYAPVGSYVYAVSMNGVVPDNYVLGDVLSATIKVGAKALVPEVEYIHGVATFSFTGTVNEDDVSVAYAVDGAPLAGSTYTASSADYDKNLAENAVVVTVTPVNNANYTVGETELLYVKKVSFRSVGDFVNATNVPREQYIYAGCTAVVPDEEPHFALHAFEYWFVDDEALKYDFDTAVTADVLLTAKWEKTVFSFKFRAMCASADYLTATYRNLAWDDVHSCFVIAEQPTSFLFTKDTVIPRDVTVAGFRVLTWVKAVKVQGDYVYTPVDRFDALVSVESDEDAFYIAKMTRSVGKGDVNGDGFVTADDVIMMKKYLVGVSFDTIATESVAWDAVGGAPVADGLYLPVWDANGDDNRDTRDVLVVCRALATGYGYAVAENVTADGEYVSGQQIVDLSVDVFVGCVTPVADAEALGDALAGGRKAGLTADVDISDLDAFVSDGDVYVDLGGKTLTVGAFDVVAAGSITLKNGVLKVNGSFTATAPMGVFFVNVTDEIGAPRVASGEDQIVISD